MNAEYQCPACGEAVTVEVDAEGGAVEIVCGACGFMWFEEASDE